MYYIYHIPGKKIGVTRNLNNRVTLMQGYKKGEYEVLEKNEDIDYISKKEIKLQEEYGYKIDKKLYNELVKKNNKIMNLNITEQTTTFPFPVNKLKGNLMDNKGFQWETNHGIFILSHRSIQWIMNHVQTSMYNNNRCYIYNKTFANWCETPCAESKTQKLLNSLPLKIFEDIREWGTTRGIYEKGDSKTQYVKLQEEAGELAKALLDNDTAEVIDAIGDMVVVLTNLAHLEGIDIEVCIETAYKEISKRTGKMINGTFVKDE